MNKLKLALLTILITPVLYGMEPNVSNKDIIDAIVDNELTLDQLNAWLQAGHDINDPIDTAGATLLHVAAYYEALDSAKIVLDKKANPNIKDFQGNTALLYTIETIAEVIAVENVYDMIKLLLTNGANVASANNKGKTLLKHVSFILDQLKLEKQNPGMFFDKDVQTMYKIQQLLLQHYLDTGLIQHYLDTAIDPEGKKLAEEALANPHLPLKLPVAISSSLKTSKPVTPITQSPTSSPVPTYKPVPTQPTGGPAPIPGSAAAAVGANRQWPNLLQRQKLIRFAIGSALTAIGYGAYHLASVVPTDLNGEQLQDKLVTALTNRDYYYAYQLAQKNLGALQELDPAAQQNIKALIEQAEVDLINETAATKSLNPFKPNVSMQLQYLANLSRLMK